MTDADLKAALAAAAAGSTFTVPAGRYGDLKLVRLKPDLTVEFAPGAVARSLDFAYCDGLRLKGAVVDFTPDELTRGHHMAIRIVESARVTVEGAKVVGGAAVWGVAADAPAGAQAKTGGAVIGWPVGVGISGFRTPGLAVEGCDVTGFFRGVMISDSADCRVAGNRIHDTRSTPIAFADADRISIEANLLGPVRPWKYSGAGDHGDAIHGWVRSTQIADGVKRPTVGVRIIGNLFDQGDGEPILGIYLDDDALDVGFVEALIERNVILNSNSQGVRLEAVAGVVRDNLMLRTSDAAGTGAPGLVLFGQKGRALTVEGNTLPDRPLGTDDRRMVAAVFPANRFVGQGVDLAAVEAARKAWMAEHRPQTPAALESRVAELEARVRELEAALTAANASTSGALALAEDRQNLIVALAAQVAAVRAIVAE